MAKITTLRQLRTLINEYKKELIAEAKEKGGVWENFGQDKVREVQDIVSRLTAGNDELPDYDERTAARNAAKEFNEWASAYTTLS